MTAQTVDLNKPRVLYSFPHRIGAERICLTAWHQASGVNEAGANVTVLCGSQARALPPEISVHTTLSFKKIRLPYSLLGRYRMLQIHDWLTARWLNSHSSKIDLIHCWPAASLRTIRVANRKKIPCLLERPNAHTQYAFEAAEAENQHLGLQLPKHHDHSFDHQLLAHEEKEYRECTYLLSPSDFVSRTFIERDTAPEKILSHQYGYEESRFPNELSSSPSSEKALTVLYAGVCEPRKGLHYALEAWVNSSASQRGEFLICGSFVPGYQEVLAPLLKHPSIKILGHRKDLPQLMASADIFVLSSVEEGSALVTYEAIGSGCVLLVSEASGAHCTHLVDSLVHPIRSIEKLTHHLDLLDGDRNLLKKLRHASFAKRESLTWSSAGRTLLARYQDALTAHSHLL